MSRPTHTHTTESIPHSLTPAGGGWHCNHLYYSFDRTALNQLSAEERAAGSRALAAALDPAGPHAPIRLQTTITSGHKADFGVMLLDPDPLKIDRVHQRLMATQLGPALLPRWSFVSITEISEYVQSPEQFGERLIIPKEERNKLMIEHARSGMAFAGKVSQLITVGIGLDDWEWGVTLWAANPEYLKEIVYRMRFDEASARYAEFGPFYTGYVATPAEILAHCQV
jgi:chlorite dismutase